MTVGAQNREVLRHVVNDRRTLGQAVNRPKVVRLNEAFPNRTIPLGKIQRTNLAPGTVMPLCSTSGDWITLNL